MAEPETAARAEGTRAETSVQPPGPPWSPLVGGQEGGGFLSFYYSDQLSRLPVRGVTRLADNKSDPNLETATYGLFSTCGPMMRSSIVRRGLSYIFFQTRWHGERVVTGYYHVGWFVDHASSRPGDAALAADIVHFVAEPIPVRALRRLIGRRVSTTARGPQRLRAPECARLRRALDGQTDSTRAYLNEIDRLERFNLRFGGSRHLNWHSTNPNEAFSWETARKYLPRSDSTVNSSAPSRNVSSTGAWTCMQCGGVRLHPVLLRLCPICGTRASLRPSTIGEASRATGASSA